MITARWVRTIFPPTQLREKSCCCKTTVFPPPPTRRDNSADSDRTPTPGARVSLLRGTARAHSRVLHQPCTVRACPARRACFQTKTTWRSSILARRGGCVRPLVHPRRHRPRRRRLRRRRPRRRRPGRRHGRTSRCDSVAARQRPRKSARDNSKNKTKKEERRINRKKR